MSNSSGSGLELSSRRQLPSISRKKKYNAEKVKDNADETENKPCSSHTDNHQMKPKAICTICQKEFSRLYNLFRHQRTRHLVQNPKLKFNLFNICKLKKNHACNVCLKTFTKKEYLMKHKKNVHKIDIGRKQSKATNYICDICSKSLSNKYSSRIHKQRVHGIKVPPKFSISLKCSECLSSFLSKEAFIDHQIKIHELPVQTETLEFQTTEDFEKWKSSIEEQTTSRYIVQSRYSTKTGLMTSLYMCHRNGHFTSKGSGKRRMKNGGTNKIDFFCPASIFVQAISVGKRFPAIVKFISCHVGHSCEVGKLGLSKEEKDQIAGQILSGVPLRNVLANIVQIASPTKRLAATNIQDVRNVAKKFGGVSNITSFNSGVKSVDAWANGEISSESSSISMGNLADELSETDFSMVKETEKNVLSEALSRKHFQQETKDIVLEFVSKLESFTSEEQCSEINKTIATLIYKCEALAVKQEEKLPPVLVRIAPK